MDRVFYKFEGFLIFFNKASQPTSLSAEAELASSAREGRDKMKVLVGIALMVGGVAVTLGSIKSGDSNILMTGIGIVAGILGVALTFFRK